MKRIKYFDLLRCVCFCFIVFYHMMVQLQIEEIYPAEKVAPFFSNPNMHIATLGVAVFFMLSGAGLAYTTKDKFDIKKFYKSRFTKILIPFYLVTILCFFVEAIFQHSIFNVYQVPIPKWSIIYTVLGIDCWVGMHGYATFSLGIGEWFLGVLIILYLLFPLLRFLMQKNRRIFFIVATSIYLIVICNYSFVIPMHENLLLKGYEFILGMLLGCYYNEFEAKWACVSVPIVVFFFTSSTALNWNYALMITLLAVAFWVSFSYLEPVLQKSLHITKIIDIISKYSFEVFLVHHIVIYKMTPMAKPYITGKLSVVLLFIIQLLLMAVLAVFVKWISNKCVHLLRLKTK